MQPEEESNPRRELVSRAVMIILGGAIGAAGIVVARVGWRLFFYSVYTGAMIFLAGVFLLLVAGTLFWFAFLPSRDTAQGPLRGFGPVSAMFDAFWGLVVTVVEIFGRF